MDMKHLANKSVLQSRKNNLLATQQQQNETMLQPHLSISSGTFQEFFYQREF